MKEGSGTGLPPIRTCFWRLGVRVLGLTAAIQVRFEPNQQTPLRYHLARDVRQHPDPNRFRLETLRLGHFDIRSNGSPGTRNTSDPWFRRPFSPI